MTRLKWSIIRTVTVDCFSSVWPHLPSSSDNYGSSSTLFIKWAVKWIHRVPLCVVVKSNLWNYCEMFGEGFLYLRITRCSSQTDAHKSAIFKCTGFRKQSAGGCWGWLLYLSWQWFGNPKMLLCNRRVCTWLQNLSLLLSLADRLKTTSFPQQTSSCCVLSLQGRLISTAEHGDFLNSSLKKPVCISSLCFLSSLLHHCHFSRGRFSRTFLTWQLSDCLRIIWCCSHVGRTGRGLLKKIQSQRERESVDLCNVELTALLYKFLRLQGGDTVKATGSTPLGHWVNQTV